MHDTMNSRNNYKNDFTNNIDSVNINFNDEKKNDVIVCTEIRKEENITGFFHKIIAKNKTGCCERTIIGLLILFTIIGSINFILVITSILTTIKKNAYYQSFRAEVMLSQGDYYSYFTGSSSDNENIPTFTNFWCNVGKVEDGILISYMVFHVIFLCFEIFSLLLHSNVIKLEIKGIIYNIIVLINIIYLVIFYIYIPLILFLFLYSLIVLAASPLDVNYSGNQSRIKTFIEKEWNEHKTAPIINLIILLLIYICIQLQTSIKSIIIIYLNMTFEEDNINKEKIKKNTILIDNKNINIEVKANQLLYLKEVGANTFYKFKEMKIEGEKDDFFFVRLENEAIVDILSFTDWEYSYFNELFCKLAKISKLIYGILIVSVFSFKMHIKNEITYKLILEAKDTYTNKKNEKPKLFDVFTMYGSLEKGFSESRFSLYLISLFIILLIMLKRIFFGGFSKSIYSLISFVLLTVFLLLNLIYDILSVIMAFMTMLSLSSYYDIFKGIKEDMIQAKLYMQLFINITIAGLITPIFIYTIRLMQSFNKIRNEVKNLNNNTHIENEERKKGFKYTGLDQKEHTLNEYEIDGHPKKLYYTLDYNKINNINKTEVNKALDFNNNNQDKTIANIEKSTVIVDLNNKNNNNNINNTGDLNIIKENNNEKNNKNLERRNSKKPTKRKSKISRYNEVGIEEKIQKENNSLRSENNNLKNELEKLKNQLNSMIGSIKA